MRSKRSVVAVVTVGVLAVGSMSAWAGARSAAPAVPTQVPPGSDPEVIVSVSPVRVFDTRVPIGVAAVGPLRGGTQIDLPLTTAAPNRPLAPLPAGATAAILNITIDDDASQKAFVTIWPTGEPRPVASVNNAEPGRVAPNQTVARLGSTGSISIYLQQGAANLAIDLAGYLVPASDLPHLGAPPPAYAFGVDDSPVSLAPFASTSLTGEFGYGPEQVVFSVPTLPAGDYLLAASVSFSKLPDTGNIGQNDIQPQCWWSTEPDRPVNGFAYAFVGPGPTPVSVTVNGRIAAATTADLVCRYGNSDADDSSSIRDLPLDVGAITVNVTPVSLATVG